VSPGSTRKPSTPSFTDPGRLHRVATTGVPDIAHDAHDVLVDGRFEEGIEGR
jgi:hypothetical protein